jgi:hypothetical protein
VCLLVCVVHVCVCAGLRDGAPSSHYDRVFDNEINIAVVRAKVRRVRVTEQWAQARLSARHALHPMPAGVFCS